MGGRLRNLFLLSSAAGLVFSSTVLVAPLAASETAETVLIRQILEKDRFGRRRGDAEVVTYGYDKDRFVVYDGAGSIDVRAWTVRHSSLEEYQASLEADLAANRYDISRAVLFLTVWKNRAFAATLDSGVVIDRAGDSRRGFVQRAMWSFLKEDEEWKATSLVIAVGDTADGGAAGRVEDQEVAAALQEDARNWSEGSKGDILSGVQEDFVGNDCYYSSNPASWLTVFAGREEFGKWLEQRLEHVDYDIERTLLHAVSRGDEAVAVTRDRITVTYTAGDARLEQDRTSAWLLTRRGGRWRVTCAWWKAKSFDPPGAPEGAPTAQR